jgi:hypothetical protein
VDEEMSSFSGMDDWTWQSGLVVVPRRVNPEEVVFGSSLSLELARLTGTETCEQDIGLHHGRGNRVCFSDSFEIDRLQFVRLPADFSGSLPWRMMRDHCFLANRSESFYTSISPEQWLRTVITTQKPSELFESYFLNEYAGLEIRSNIVPRWAFLTRLEGVLDTCHGHQCSGGFLRSCDLRAGDPLCQSYDCKKCALAKHLKTEADHMRSGVELDRRPEFWFVGAKDVKLMEFIKGGSEGEIHKIFWRNGTFVMKRFFSSDVPHRNSKFCNEFKVALAVSHPNIVHCFGCSRWWDSTEYDLFMEVLEEDLESFLSRLEDMRPLFSFHDTLEVLLQVAKAMQHLHEKNFIHGDLKPGNILLSKLPVHSDVPFYLVKVADFGCTQQMNPSGAVEAFDFKIGTYSYTAPEVYRGRKTDRALRSDPEDLQKMEDLQNALQKVDPQKIDVYSFGVVAHEVVTAVEGTRLDGNRLSLALGNLIQSCRAEEPQHRPLFGNICEVLSSVMTG